MFVDAYSTFVVTDGASLTPFVEEMVLQLFELVNEKNEMFRRQAELMYLWVKFIFTWGILSGSISRGFITSLPDLFSHQTKKRLFSSIPMLASTNDVTKTKVSLHLFI